MENEKRRYKTITEAPVIVITGASSGIGAAAARLFARQGYRVVLAARRLERLQSLAGEIQPAGGPALPVQVDLGRLEDIQRMTAITLEHFGQIDILFNNAGFGRLGFLETLDPLEALQGQIQVDLLGLMWATQSVLPTMIARRSGLIINMGSLAALVAPPTYSVYAAVKFGVRGFSEALRREVGMYGIGVSLICPGGVETEFAESAGVQRKSGTTTPGWLKLSAQQVAQAVLQTARRPRRIVILPPAMRLAVWLNALFPGLVDRAVQKGFVERER